MWRTLFLLGAPVFAQILTIFPGPINLVPPAVNSDGRAILFGAAMTPDARAQKGTNLYLYTQGAAAGAVKQLTFFTGDDNTFGVTSVALSGNGGFAAFSATPTGPVGVEEVHLMNLSTNVDRTLATDKERCAQPLALCFGCARSCVGPVHVNADSSKVLYAVARQQPFYVATADGAAPLNLPIYSGQLAAAPRRVITRDGKVVFVSAAPFGPTFAAAPSDVYLMNLDGTDVKQITHLPDARYYASNATISLDGTVIAFETNLADQAGNAQIYTVRSDGSALRRISTGSDGATNPSISADGSTVTFIEGGQIKKVNLNGDLTPLALTRLSVSTARDSVLSDDGAQVVFTTGPIDGRSAAVNRIPTNAPTELRNFVSVYAPRFLSDGGVASAAGYGTPSPGSLISVYGFNLGLDEFVNAKTFPLPTTLGDLSLTVNGQPVPLATVTPWQINAQLPQGTAAGPQTARVQYLGGFQLSPVNFETTDFSPFNFYYAFTKGGLFYQQAAAFHAGTAIPADIDHPATAGEVLEIYAVGLGRTIPAVAAGEPSPSSPPAKTIQIPRVQIGRADATVTFAGLTPGLAGVYQVNVRMPSGLSTGLQTLSWPEAIGTTSVSSIAIK